MNRCLLFGLLVGLISQVPIATGLEEQCVTLIRDRLVPLEQPEPVRRLLEAFRKTGSNRSLADLDEQTQQALSAEVIKSDLDLELAREHALLVVGTLYEIQCFNEAMAGGSREQQEVLGSRIDADRSLEDIVLGALLCPFSQDE